MGLDVDWGPDPHNDDDEKLSLWAGIAIAAFLIVGSFLYIAG